MVGPKSPTVFVYVWFDIEDFVTEESNDLPLKALEILRKYRVPATCKMVAEKVRFLKEHGRDDVIAEIGNQDVGYHTDTHSIHPTVYEYLAEKDVIEGAEEFRRRESPGLRYVEKVFRRRASCFGHPGPSWTTHFYPAMKKMGIPVYLDETPIVDADGSPYRLGGVLNLNGANANFLRFDYTFEDPSGNRRLRSQFLDIHDRLRAKGGGAISFLFHLHTSINREFFDAVNFAHGENRPRRNYVRPDPQPSSVTRRAWRDFDEMISYMASFEDVRFITASDAAIIYNDEELTFDRELIDSVLRRMGNNVQYVKADGGYASPSQLLYVVAKSLAEYSKTGRLPSRVVAKEPLGPVSVSSPAAPSKISARDMLKASAMLLDYVDSRGVLPSSVALGEHSAISLTDFLVTGSKLLRKISNGGAVPLEVAVAKGRFTQSKHVNVSEFRKACEWIVLPDGFVAPKIFEQILLQCWTLRPAVATMLPQEPAFHSPIRMDRSRASRRKEPNVRDHSGDSQAIRVSRVRPSPSPPRPLRKT